MKGRLICLALDAADVGLIQTWAGNAGFRAFRRIVVGRKMIRVDNEPGLYVGSIWPTISTGSAVASHGRYCWRQLRLGRYEDEFFQADQIKGEPIWEKLEKSGKSVCVIDIPKSIPGIMFKGRFVKDWGTHDPSTGGFKIYGWMKAVEFLMRYGKDEVGRCDAIERTMAGFEQFRDRLIARAGSRARMVRDVLSEGKEDVVMVSFSESHCVGHQCWHLHDPQHELHDRMLRSNLGDPVLDVYKALDGAVESILENIGELDTVIILATHGMGLPYNAVELLNSIVADLEFGSLDVHDQDELRSFGIPHLLSNESADFRRRLRVFPVPNNGAHAAFRLNIKGREPDGRLAPEDADQFLHEFHDKIMAITNADTGEKLFVSAIFRQGSYSGSPSDDLPDLLLEWNRSSPIRRVVTPRSILSNSNGGNPRTGDHRAGGGMWVIGPGASSLESFDSLRSSEIAKCMMHIAGNA
jgi:predicted AlkP superfamily phosphohydrolase/phosphomutase